jgi:PAS domain S-box-containing protein
MTPGLFRPLHQIFNGQTGLLRTLAAALLCFVLMGVFAAYQIYHQAEAASRNLEQVAVSIARVNAAEIARIVKQAETFLEKVAVDPGIRSLDRQHCGHWFDHFIEIYPQHSNLLTKDLNGYPVCSGLPVVPGVKINLRNYLNEVQHNNGFAIGTPNQGALSKRWVVPLDFPIRDDSGNIVGTVSAPLDLLKFNPFLGAGAFHGLPDGTTATLFAPDMTMLARSLDPENWVGSRSVQVPELIALVTGRAETARIISQVDHMERIHGAAKVPGTAWTTIASIPTAPIKAARDAEIRMWEGILAVTALALLGLVYGWARRAAEPRNNQSGGAVASHPLPTDAVNAGAAFVKQRRKEHPFPFFAVLFVTLGLFGYLFWSSYQSTRSQALVAANNVSEILASSIQDMLERAHSDLLVFAPQLTPDDLAGRASPARQADLEARMGFHLRSFPAVIHYLVLDAQGNRLFGSAAANSQSNVSYGDRTWFQQLRDHPDLDLVLSEVLIGRVTQRQTFIMGSAIRDGESHLLGVMVAAFDLAEWQSRIDHLDVGNTGLVAVRRTDNNALVLRRPQLVEQINEPAKPGGMSDLIRPDRSSGTGEFTSPVDQITRLYAYRTLSPYPLNVVVGISTADYFAPWRRQAALSGMGALVLIAILMAMYRRRLAVQQRLSISEGHLAAELARFKAVLTAASDGIHVLDADGTVLEASDSFCRMLGYPRDEIIGMKVSQWDAKFTPEALAEILDKEFTQQDLSLFETSHRRKDGTVFDVEITGYPFMLGNRRVMFNSSRDISDRKVAEARLRDSEARFRSLIEGTTDWVWETDAQHRFSWFSPSFEFILGRPLATMLGIRRWDAAADSGGTGDIWQAHLETLTRHMPFRDFRYWLTDAAGKLRWITISGSPRFDEAGIFLGYRGSGSDITERSAMSTRLRLFSKTVEQVPLAVVVTDLAGKIEYVNPHAEVLSGYVSDELIGRDASMLGDDQNAAQDEMWRTIRSGATWAGEFLNRRKDGSNYWQASTIFAVTDGEGAATHYVGIGEDVTARKRDQTALSAAHAQLSAILDNTPVGIAIISINRTFLRVNRAFSSIFSLCKDDVEGKSTRIIYRSDLDYDDIGTRAYPLVQAGGTFSSKVPMIRQDDGHPIVVSLAATLVDEANPALGVVWAAEDISERLANEEKLAQANSELELRTSELSKVNEELEQFAYVASHDLRQPLRMVNSYVSLIERRLGTDIDGDMKDFIGFARDGAHRMDSLILGLLQYSRTGRTKTSWVDVALDEVMAQAVHDLDVTIQEAGATVAVAKGLPVVVGDPIELMRLFENLLGNAVKYRAPDRAPVISITCEDSGDDWKICVVDNGIGIATDQRERAFGIFQRLVTDEQYEGTGIGLAVSKKIVELHGGRIWIEAAPGEGSIFVVTLPKGD